MRSVFTKAAASGALALALACGGDKAAGPSQAELTGTWQVTHCVFASTQGLGTVDLIAGGGSGTLVIGADDTLRLTVTPASGAAVNVTATYVAGGDILQVTPVGVAWSWEFEMALSAGTLTLGGASGDYDIDGDTQPDPAVWSLTMTR